MASCLSGTSQTDQSAVNPMSLQHGGLGESRNSRKWVSSASVVPEAPGEDAQFAVFPSSSLQSHSVQNGEMDCDSICCSAGDGSPRHEEEFQHKRMPAPRCQSGVQIPPSLRSAELREAPELGASAPSTVSMAEQPEVCQRDCSNPLAHHCLACRQKQMENEFHRHVPGYLAAENESEVVPCCSLSSELHTIVHVCDCMSPFELDRALAMENLRLERVRDAHAVVLTISRKYGIERVLQDPDLMVIVYKYDEMMRMYAMMGAPICLRRKQSYFRRVTSSFALESPTGRRKRSLNFLAEEELQVGPQQKQEIHDDPALSAPQHVENDERLRDAMRQQFGMRSLGALTNIHVPPADASWNLAVQESNGLKIFFRRHASSTLISFRVEGRVDANILNIISVLNEMDLYKDWIPYYSFPVKLGLREVTKLYQLGRVEQIDLLQLDFPWPMNNRDCCVEIWAADDLDYTNRFFIRITSLDGGDGNPRVPLTVPMPPNKTLRLYCEGAVILIPLSRDKTFIELFWTLDAKVHLSDYIVNFFTKVFAKSSFHAFCKVCANASGGEHARRRQNYPLLYAFVEKRLAEVEKAYEHNKEEKLCPPSLGSMYAKSSSVEAPLSPQDSSTATNPKAPTEHSVGAGMASRDSNAGVYLKKGRSGKIGFPFRRRRSSFLSEASKS